MGQLCQIVNILGFSKCVHLLSMIFFQETILNLPSAYSLQNIKYSPHLTLELYLAGLCPSRANKNKAVMGKIEEKEGQLKKSLKDLMTG